MPRIALALVLALTLLPAAAFACLWDYDTLKMERQRFPLALELITGKFLRHSPEFYQWRLKDRQAKLKKEPARVEYYDDLAVAYDKLGQPERAIETMQAKEKIQPGLYETEANLATFYIHAGDLEQGLEHVEKALQINPNAHFGREKYQKYLVEYLLARRTDGKLTYPLSRGGGFADFLKGKLGDKWGKASREEALRGVQGMVRFAKWDSPLLQEVLGDLLAHNYSVKKGGFGEERDFDVDANLLAARAYLQASYHVKDEETRDAYRELASGTLKRQYKPKGGKLSLDELEAEFTKKLKDADAWYQKVRAAEIRWIAAGKDADAEFTKVYYQQPKVDVK
jgi:tetratricopeptide (TPR) repeat protein